MLYILAILFLLICYCSFCGPDYEEMEKKDYSDEKIQKFELASFCIFIISGILLVVTIRGVLLVYSQTNTYEELSNTQAIISFDDSNIEKYICKYQVKDNKYDTLKFDKEKSELIEEDSSEEARVCTYTLYRKSTMNKVWSCILVFDSQENPVKLDVRYEIYVPEGTIKKFTN